MRTVQIVRVWRKAWRFVSFLWGFCAHFVTPQKGNSKEGFLCIPPKVASSRNWDLSKSYHSSSEMLDLDGEYAQYGLKASFYKVSFTNDENIKYLLTSGSKSILKVLWAPNLHHCNDTTFKSCNFVSACSIWYTQRFLFEEVVLILLHCHHIFTYPLR